MPLDSTAERVPEPPQEEASEVAKKQPEGRPELRVVAPPEEATLEVSPAAQETFSDQAQETVAGLQPESKGFVGKLYEKVKSSEVVQNVVDRYQVWRNEGLATRAQSKVDKLGVSQKGAQEEGARFDASAIKFKELHLKMQADLRATGGELSPEAKNLMKAEYDAHLARAEKGHDKAQEIEGRIQDVRGAKEEHEARVNDARGHLDGRLAAKAEINDQAIKDYRWQSNNAKELLESNQSLIQEVDGHIEKLRVYLKEDISKYARPDIEKQLKDLESRKAIFLTRKKGLEVAGIKLETKINGLEAKNADLQAKRDKIFPPKEKSAKTEKPAEKPIEIDINQFGDIGFKFGGGKELIISHGKGGEFKADGSVSEIDLDSADDTVLDYLTKVTAGALESAGVSPKVIARVEKVKAARQLETEKQPKFLAGDIVAAWNQEVRKGSGWQVSLEKSADPKKDLGSEIAAKDMLLTLLAKKINKGNVKGLLGSAKGKVENFFAKRSAARR